VQAAAQGIVDFSHFAPFDRNWWIRLRWLLDELDVTNLRQMLHLQHAQHSGALNYLAGKDTFDHHWRAAGKILTQLTELYFPWTIDEKTTRRADDYASMYKLLVERCGDPKDPATQAKIKQTVDYLKSLVKPKNKKPGFEKQTATPANKRRRRRGSSVRNQPPKAEGK
jgi:hypothetical protein